MRITAILFFIVALVFQSFRNKTDTPFSGEVMGYKPVYIAYDKLKEVSQ
ncbi:MAG: hypothetical protein ACI9V1_003267 [Spirosomataceae bacterium]|jgi:hypothetical protein